MVWILSTDLNLSHNQMSKLPDELADLALERLDISHNSFTTLPQVVFKMPKLRQLYANNNSIIEVESDEKSIKSESLELVDLRNNPLTPQCYERLRAAKLHFHIDLSERVQEDWEDLTIWFQSVSIVWMQSEVEGITGWMLQSQDHHLIS